MKVDLSTAVMGDVYLNRHGERRVFINQVQGHTYPYKFSSLTGTRSYTVNGEYYVEGSSYEDLVCLAPAPVRKPIAASNRHKHDWTPICHAYFGFEGRTEVSWCSTCGALSFKSHKGKRTYMKVKRPK
jgi:hypothetical protein